jgi:ubiquitin-conjugating enzyme E2 C
MSSSSSSYASSGSGGSSKASTGSSSGPTGPGAVQKRLQQELMALLTAGSKDVTAFPDGDNMFEWVGTIKGSNETAYAGLSFKLRLKFPADYPFAPPTITFTTPIFHPNVDPAGNICLDILKEKWTAAYSVQTVLLSLQTLLGDPNNASPLNGQAAGLWAQPIEYRKMVLKKFKEATGSAPDV